MLAVLLLAGCGGPPADTKEATIVEPTAPATTTAPQTPAGEVKVYSTTDASEFKWTGYKVIGQHSGWFIIFDGTAEVPGGNLEQATFELEVETMSVETDNAQLTKVMVGKDFFWCDEHPNMTFKSTKVEQSADGFWVTGDLTLRGVTKSIRFPAKIVLEGDVLKLKAQFTVNRRWWNIVYEGVGDSVLKNDVLIELNVTAEAG
jgi:polyisoprenoid-binding protein YceI